MLWSDDVKYKFNVRSVKCIYTPNLLTIVNSCIVMFSILLNLTEQGSNKTIVSAVLEES